jgi:hypothetical protein
MRLAILLFSSFIAIAASSNAMAETDSSDNSAPTWGPVVLGNTLQTIFNWTPSLSVLPGLGSQSAVSQQDLIQREWIKMGWKGNYSPTALVGKWSRGSVEGIFVSGFVNGVATILFVPDAPTDAKPTLQYATRAAIYVGANGAVGGLSNGLGVWWAQFRGVPSVTGLNSAIRGVGARTFMEALRGPGWRATGGALLRTTLGGAVVVGAGQQVVSAGVDLADPLKADGSNIFRRSILKGGGAGFVTFCVAEVCTGGAATFPIVIVTLTSGAASGLSDWFYYWRLKSAAVPRPATSGTPECIAARKAVADAQDNLGKAQIKLLGPTGVRVDWDRFLEPYKRKLADAKAEEQRICNTPTKIAALPPRPPLPPPPTATNPPAPLAPPVVGAGDGGGALPPTPAKSDCPHEKEACLAAMVSYGKAAHINFDLPPNPDVSLCLSNYPLVAALKPEVRQPELRQPLAHWASARNAYLQCKEKVASTDKVPVPIHGPRRGSGGLGTHSQTYVPRPSVGGDNGSGGRPPPLRPSVGGDNGSDGSVGVAAIPRSVGGDNGSGGSAGGGHHGSPGEGAEDDDPEPPTPPIRYSRPRAPPIPRTRYSRPRYIPRAHQRRAYRPGGRGGGSGGHHPSDIRLKHDIVPLGRLDNGLGVYRFSYNGSSKVYVGVMAQEVQSIKPEAVVRGRDGYLRVNYERLGLHLQTWDQWLASGQRIPVAADASRL